MLTEPAIWSATDLERVWHTSIAVAWQHRRFCTACTESETPCDVGRGLDAVEQAAWRAARAERYVPLAVKP